MEEGLNKEREDLIVLTEKIEAMGRFMSSLTRTLVHELLDTTSPPILDCVRLLLSFKKTSISKVAKKAKVSRQAAYADISGKEPCPRFRKEIEKIFGFIPWT